MKKKIKSRGLKITHPNAAGIDIGATKHYVAVPKDRAEESVRSFGCFTKDLHRLVDWLKGCGIDTVAMESTSVYWIPLFNLLEQNNIEVYLVNARKSKTVPGRKTDVQDCQWLQELHSYGLLQASFQIAQELKPLRTILRHRSILIKKCSSEIQRMQKCLVQMNFQIQNVISDITGESGLKILKAIVLGERDPNVLYGLCNSRIKATQEVIIDSLEGTWAEVQIFVLGNCIEMYEFCQSCIVKCDEKIEYYLNLINQSSPTSKFEVPPSSKRSQSRKQTNVPKFDMRTYLYKISGVDLTRISGLSSYSVMVILSETGMDMNKWPTVKHFTSWLGLCPRNKISGDRVISSRTSRAKNKASIMFRSIAQGMNNSKSGMGAYFRRLKSKIGVGKACVATARKIAEMFYLMLKEKRVYDDIGEEGYLKKFKDRQVKFIQKRAAMLGYSLVQNLGVS